MRVLTMQSKDVLDILKNEGVYHADGKYSREQATYDEDREQLGGQHPIWCWAYPCMDFVTLCNNEVLEYLRCEMSLEQDNCWDNFYMLEVEVPYHKLKIGKHHNGCPWSRVFGELRASDVIAVYTIKDSNVEGLGYYFKVVTPIWSRDGCVQLIPMEMDCRYYANVEDQPLFPMFERRSTAKCIACGEETDWVFWNKHLCSIKCACRLVDRYKTWCSVLGVDALKYEAILKCATDEAVGIDMKQFIMSHCHTQ